MTDQDLIYCARQEGLWLDSEGLITGGDLRSALPFARRAIHVALRQMSAASRSNDITELLTWTPASTKPDADTTVLCWRDTGEWFSGWWDDQAGAWFDAASGGIVDGVTHWADVGGPQ